MSLNCKSVSTVQGRRRCLVCFKHWKKLPSAYKRASHYKSFHKTFGSDFGWFLPEIEEELLKPYLKNMSYIEALERIHDVVVKVLQKLADNEVILQTLLLENLTIIIFLRS